MHRLDIGSEIGPLPTQDVVAADMQHMNISGDSNKLPTLSLQILIFNVEDWNVQRNGRDLDVALVTKYLAPS